MAAKTHSGWNDPGKIILNDAINPLMFFVAFKASGML